jgi:hypothetical protein
MLEVIFREAPQDRFGVPYAESQRSGELDEFIVLPFNPAFLVLGILPQKIGASRTFAFAPGWLPQRPCSMKADVAYSTL